MISIGGEMAVYSSPVSCTQMLFSWSWRKRIEITMDRIKGEMGNSEWDLLLAAFFFYVCRLTNICKAKQAAVKCWKGDVLWDTVLSYTCVWFWRDSARRDPSTGNIYRIEYLEAPRRFIMRPRVCNSLHFSPTTAECVENVERRNDGWINRLV